MSSCSLLGRNWHGIPIITRPHTQCHTVRYVVSIGASSTKSLRDLTRSHMMIAARAHTILIITSPHWIFHAAPTGVSSCSKVDGLSPTISTIRTKTRTNMHTKKRRRTRKTNANTTTNTNTNASTSTNTKTRTNTSTNAGRRSETRACTQAPTNNPTKS